MPIAASQAIFPLIAAGDIAGVSTILDSDPMLVHVRQAGDEQNHAVPLQYAASLGHLDLCRLLVDRGAEVYTNAANTYPPIILAAWNQHADVVKYFVEEIPAKAAGTNGLGVSITLAARQGWAAIVAQHIERDPLSIHQRGWIGETPLHWSAHNNHVEIVTMLLAAGAEVEADEIFLYGGKPLHWASEHAPACVTLLLDHGANVNSRNTRSAAKYFRMTPLIWNATQRDDCAEATELLIAAGADTSAVDANGRTALSHATERSLTRICDVLQRHGAG